MVAYLIVCHLFVSTTTIAVTTILTLLFLTMTTVIHSSVGFFEDVGQLVPQREITRGTTIDKSSLGSTSTVGQQKCNRRERQTEGVRRSGDETSLEKTVRQDKSYWERYNPYYQEDNHEPLPGLSVTFSISRDVEDRFSVHLDTVQRDDGK